MAHRNSKRYPEEFKKQIVDLYHAGTPVAKLASEYGLVDQTIYKWIKLYSPITETVSMKEFKELQKKMAQLKMENEILKKLQPYSPKNIK